MGLVVHASTLNKTATGSSCVLCPQVYIPLQGRHPHQQKSPISAGIEPILFSLGNVVPYQRATESSTEAPYENFLKHCLMGLY